MWPFTTKVRINIYRDNSQNPNKVVYANSTPQADYEIPLGDVGRISNQTNALINILNKSKIPKRIVLESLVPISNHSCVSLSKEYLEKIAKQLTDITEIRVSVRKEY